MKNQMNGNENYHIETINREQAYKLICKYASVESVRNSFRAREILQDPGCLSLAPLALYHNDEIVELWWNQSAYENLPMNEFHAHEFVVTGNWKIISRMMES